MKLEDYTEQCCGVWVRWPKMNQLATVLRWAARSANEEAVSLVFERALDDYYSKSKLCRWGQFVLSINQEIGESGDSRVEGILALFDQHQEMIRLHIAKDDESRTLFFYSPRSKNFHQL